MSIHISCDMYLRLELHVQIRLICVLPYKAKVSAQHGIGFILDRCIVYLGLTMPNLQKKRLLIFEIFNIKKCTLFLGTENILNQTFVTKRFCGLSRSYIQASQDVELTYLALKNLRRDKEAISSTFNNELFLCILLSLFVIPALKALELSGIFTWATGQNRVCENVNNLLTLKRISISNVCTHNSFYGFETVLLSTLYYLT